MVAKRFIAPDLSNATPSMLLDEMGKLSMVENATKKLRAFYKEAYYARTGIRIEEMELGDQGARVNDGEIFRATTTRTMPMRLDQTRLKEEKPDIYNEYLKQGDQLTTRFELKEGVENPIVNDLMNQIKAELDLD